MIRFLISLSIVALLLILAVWACSAFLDWPLPTFWIEIFAFSFSITAIITYKLFELRKKQPQAFVQFYLLSITLKMLAGLGFVFFLIWKSPAETRANVGLFLLAYLLFTLVEVAALMRGKQ